MVLVCVFEVGLVFVGIYWFVGELGFQYFGFVQLCFWYFEYVVVEDDEVCLFVWFQVVDLVFQVDGLCSVVGVGVEYGLVVQVFVGVEYVLWVFVGYCLLDGFLW